MSDEPKDEGGIFGKLPDSRPGTRSPRRANAAQATKKAAPKARAKPKPKAAPKRAAPKKPPPEPAPPRPAEPSRPIADQTPGGIGDIAWAGIAVAAEAATIGVRLASRAIEAVRGNPEKD